MDSPNDNWNNLPEPTKLFAIYYVAAWIVGTNPEHLARAPRGERMAVVGDAMLLLLVAVGSTVAWTCFFSMFLWIPTALLLGLFFGAFILCLDRALTLAAVKLSGILRRPGKRLDGRQGLMAGGRLIFAVILSFATSTGATMALFHDSIKTEVQIDRQRKNERVEYQYIQKEESASDRILGRLKAEVKKYSDMLRDTVPLLDNAKKRQAAGNAEVGAAQLDANFETGVRHKRRWYRKGYRGAVTRKEAAAGEVARAEADIAMYGPRVAETQKRLDQAVAELQSAEPTAALEIGKLEKEKLQHLIPERYDAMINYRALQRIYRDPEDGPVARFFGELLMAVILAVEMSFFCVKTIWRPASITDAETISETVMRAEQIAARDEKRKHAIRTDLEQTVGPRQPPAPLRIASFTD